MKVLNLDRLLLLLIQLHDFENDEELGWFEVHLSYHNLRHSHSLYKKHMSLNYTLLLLDINILFRLDYLLKKLEDII